MRSKNVVTLLIVAVGLVLPMAVGAEEAADIGIATEVVSSNSLAIQAASPFVSARVGIAGPQGLEANMTLEGGNAINVNLRAAEWRQNREDRQRNPILKSDDGFALPDGLYKYVVRLYGPDGSHDVVDGEFFVKNGVAMSREAVRAEISETRQVLDDAASSGREGPALKTLSETDWIAITDSPNDGTTYLSLDSDGTAGNDLYWILWNNNSDLEIVQDTGFIPPGTTRMRFDRSAGEIELFGEVGIGTAAPIGELHIADGVPEIRLQDTDLGGATFVLESVQGAPQFEIFEVGGSNELFTIESGAPARALYLDSIGSIGVNTVPTAATLHVRETDDVKHSRVLARMEGSDFEPQFEYTNATTGKTWRLGSNPSGQFVINQTDDLGIAEMLITPAGEVRVNGTQVHPDYVFDSSYELMSVPELKEFVTANGHLPGVISAEEADGTIELTSLPLQMLEKIEELALYTIGQHEQIEAQQAIIDEQRQQNEAMRAEIDALKAAVRQLGADLP